MAAPLAIVRQCALRVSEYALVGKEIEVPELSCLSCGTRLRPWSWFQRVVREMGDRPVIWIRRDHCRPCVVTHALLPEVETSGEA